MKHELIKRVFVVDDDPVWTGVIIQSLAQLGYKDIMTFESGEECMEHMYFRPNLIFLDYQMAGMNGIDVLREIRTKLPKTGIIFCSARADMDVAVDAIKNGSSDFMLKSKYTLEDLSRILDKMHEAQVFSDNIY